MTEKQNRPRLATGSGGENAAGAFNPHYTPQIAQGNTRECLDALITQADARAQAEQTPERRRKINRLVRYLTMRLARAILREARP